jgi:ribA/ribD-fused uncharacterized protein
MNTTQTPVTLDDLRRRFNRGERFKFLHFWGHRIPADGAITQSCFSQWYASPFTIDDVRYPTAEHFMMASKAKLFSDEVALEKILRAKSPAEAKRIGREVLGFDETKWSEHRFAIVVAASKAKFAQNAEMCRFLVGTNDRVLVEASPVDRIWGIGLAAADHGANNPNQWKGLNLLGFALMVARLELAP